MYFVWEVVKSFLIVGAFTLGFIIVYDVLKRGSMPEDTRFNLFRSTTPSSHQIAYLPGILADGVLSSDPIRSTWREFGDVLCVSYGTERFRPDEKSRVIAKKLVSLLRKTEPLKLTFVLSSMGAILGLDAWAQVRSTSSIPSEVELVIIDGIQGAHNMKEKGPIPAPILRCVLFLLRFGPLSNKLLGPGFRKMQQPPKDEDIQGDLDKDRVKADAMEAMAPYEVSVWRDQLAYMAGHKALRPWHFGGVTRVYYLMCTKNNATIKQPDESRKWEQVCETAGVEFVRLRVPTPHCAYAQMPRIWNQAFRQVLSGQYKK